MHYSGQSGEVEMTKKDPLHWLRWALIGSAWLSSYVAAQPDGVARSEIERGEYLTTILGCGGCHTEGALLGEPTGPWLAGSRIGIGYAEYPDGSTSAIVFPSNLTSDATGIGSQTQEDIVEVLTSGRKHTGEIGNMVMPWANYRLLNTEDLVAIAAYLKSLPAVENKIPQHIAPGQDITESYVRFGVYLFVPEPVAKAPER